VQFAVFACSFDFPKIDAPFLPGGRNPGFSPDWTVFGASF